MKCKHTHECVECVKAEIKVLEEKLAVLKAKLPTQTIVIHNYPIPYIQYFQVPVPVPMYSSQQCQLNTYCANATAGTTSAQYTQLQ